jgi:hypothetical protein
LLTFYFYEWAKPYQDRSYINRMESFKIDPKSYIQHPINTRMSHAHGTIHTSAHTVSNDIYGSSTKHTWQTRIVRVYTASHVLVYTVLHGLYVSTNHNYLLPPSAARSTRSTCCITLECVQRKEKGSQAQKENKGHSGQPTIPTCKPCRAWWAGGPNNVCQSYPDF